MLIFNKAREIAAHNRAYENRLVSEATRSGNVSDLLEALRGGKIQWSFGKGCVTSLGGNFLLEAKDPTHLEFTWFKLEDQDKFNMLQKLHLLNAAMQATSLGGFSGSFSFVANLGDER